MKTINKKETVLFKLLSYYFNEEDDRIKSSRELAEMFGTTRTRVNTAMGILVENKYVIPSKNACGAINKARQSYKDINFKHSIKGDEYHFDSKFVYVRLDKECADVMMKKYQIEYEELKEFSVLAFLITVVITDTKASILNVLKSIDGIMGILKSGYSRVCDKPVFSTGYTKGEPTLGF